MLGAQRERSGCELAFGLLKTLMIGYQLWGVDSGVELAELAESLCTSDQRVDGVVTYLTGEGLVCVDQAGTVRLTDHARRLLHPTRH
jgi:Mn-dependent DtxR family transcriptional regulator